MPCSLCGRHTRRWRWTCREADQDTDAEFHQWCYWVRDEAVPGRVCLLHCTPTCYAADTLRKVDEIQAEVLERVQELKELLERAHAELDEAWRFLDS